MQCKESNARYIPLRRQTTGAPKGTACTFNVVHESLHNTIAIICAFTGTIYSHRHSNGTTDFGAAAASQSGAAAPQQSPQWKQRQSPQWRPRQSLQWSPRHCDTELRAMHCYCLCGADDTDSVRRQSDGLSECGGAAHGDGLDTVLVHSQRIEEGGDANSVAAECHCPTTPLRAKALTATKWRRCALRWPPNS